MSQLFDAQPPNLCHVLHGHEQRHACSTILLHQLLYVYSSSHENLKRNYLQLISSMSLLKITPNYLMKLFKELYVEQVISVGKTLLEVWESTSMVHKSKRSSKGYIEDSLVLIDPKEVFLK